MRIIAKISVLLAFTSVLAHAMEEAPPSTPLVEDSSGPSYGSEIERNWLIKLYSLYHEIELLVAKNPDLDRSAAETFFENVLSLLKDEKATHFVDHEEESLDLFGKDTDFCKAIAAFLKDNKELLSIDINFAEKQKQKLRDNYSYLIRLKLLAQKAWFEKMFKLYQDIKKTTSKNKDSNKNVAKVLISSIIKDSSPKLDENAAETFIDSVSSLIIDNNVQKFLEDSKSFSYQFGESKEIYKLVAEFLNENKQLLAAIDAEFIVEQRRKIRKDISYLEKNSQ